MTRRSSLWLTPMLAAALVGCGHTIKFVYFPPGEIALNAMQGDTILWKNVSGITFPLGSPCKETDLKPGKCTISVPDPSITYPVPYVCDGCADPEIVVGSDSGTTFLVTSFQTTPTALVQMACPNNQVKIYPTEVMIPKATVANGNATVKWLPAGIPLIGADWQAAIFSSPICTNSPPFNMGNNTCTLKSDATGTTTFTVSSAKCSMSAQGKITITQ